MVGDVGLLFMFLPFTGLAVIGVLTAWRYIRRKLLRAVVIGLVVLFGIVPGTTLSVDTATGLFGRDGTVTTTVIPAQQGEIPEAHSAVLVAFPGFKGVGTVLAQALAPELSKHATIVALNYAKTELNLQAIYQAAFADLQRLRPTRIVLFGHSMGGMVAVDWLRRYNLADAPFGPVELLIMDSSPAGTDYIKTPAAYNALRHLPGGAISTWGTRLEARIGLKHATPPGEGSDPAVIAAGYRFITDEVDFRGLAAQGRYMAGFSLPQSGEFPGLEVHYLEPPFAHTDFLVDIDRSQRAWLNVFGSITVHAIHDWPPHSHSPILERPQEWRRTIAGVMS